MTFLSVVVLGYLLGSCPWGYWIPLLFKHEDIRRRGSGNIGASNVFRTYGTALGIPVVLLDVAKGFVPTLVGVLLVSHVCGIAAGAAAMIGHWRPLFLGFQRGGKMVATGGGSFLALAPLVALTGVVIWIVVFVLSRYASVASLVTALFIPVGAWLYGYPKPVIAFGAATCFVVFFLHRTNLQRLWHGTENRSSVAVFSMIRSRLSARAAAS
jgi:acyl phosphate:glycerol-3-phosphate acyltransferase